MHTILDCFLEGGVILSRFSLLLAHKQLNIIISFIHQTTMPRNSRKAQHIQALWEVLEKRVTERELRMITGRAQEHYR
jgi:hypothetical protein